MPGKERFNVISGYAMKWCVFAVVFAVPFSKSISEIAISISIVLLIIKKVLNRDMRFPRTSLELPFLIFVVAMIPSFFNTAYFGLSLKALFSKVLKYIAFYYVIIESIDTRSKLKDLFVMVLISVVAITVDGLIQYYGSIPDFLHRYPVFKYRAPNDGAGFFRGFPTACFPFPNDLAGWILLVLFPIGCALLFGLHGLKARVLAAISSLGLFYLLFLTKARGAWVGFAVSAVYIALSRKKLWIISLLVLALAVPFMLKMEMAKYIFGASSVSDRFFMWGTGWEIFKHHPVIGNGINTFFREFMKYRDDEWKGKKGAYAHNCYLQMAADTGVVGLAAFLFLMASYFIKVGRAIKRIKDKLHGSILLGVSMGVMAFLVLGFFDTNLYSLNLATLFWSAIGISFAIINVYGREPA